jgi:hypothetical protein
MSTSSSGGITALVIAGAFVRGAGGSLAGPNLAGTSSEVMKNA